MALSHEALVTILQTALDEPIGLLLRTSDTTKVRMLLYKARTNAGDPRLASLQFRVSPFPEGDLVICHPSPAPRQQPRPRAADLDLGDLLE